MTCGRERVGEGGSALREGGRERERRERETHLADPVVLSRVGHVVQRPVRSEE